MLRKNVAICVLSALLPICFPSQSAEILTLDAARGIQAYDDSVVVRMKAAEPGKVRALSVAGAEAKPFRTVSGLVELKRIPQGGLQALSQEQKAESLRKWIEELKASGQFDYVEPNYRYSIDLTPTDGRFTDGTLWGLNNFGQGGGVTGADIGVTNAWDLTTGSTNVIVAVVDTGVRYTHKDLVAQMWINPNEIPGNGIDDDNDGYIDNVYGADPFNNDGDPMDDVGHGTHVAGTIGAAANDGNPHVGVSWNVRLMAIKVGDDNGLPLTAIIRGIEFAADHGARVMNASFGGYAFSNAEYDALNAARQKGMLVVAAAGNDDNDNDTFPAYPASYNLDNIISVLAMDRRNTRAFFSNYGKRTVHLGAPGVEIFSTFNGSDTDYTFLQGTSMAAPHVTGVAALVAAYLPSARAQEIRQRILDGVVSVPTLADRTITGGRVNAFRALTRGVDGVMEYSITPAPDSVLTIGEDVLFSLSLTDGLTVSNATVSLTGGGVTLPLTFDSSPNSQTFSTYTNTYRVPNTPGAISFTLDATAPGKSNLTAQINYLAVNRPDNDKFTNAFKVPQQTKFVQTTSNRQATMEIGEPQHAGVADVASSIWYSFSVSHTTSVIVDTAGSTFDTVIGVYTGNALANLTEIASANNVGTRKLAWVKFVANPGISYKIAIAGVPPEDEGTVQLRIELNGEPDTVAPVVQILSPVSGLTFNDNNLTISGTAYDPEPNASGIQEGGVQYTVSTNAFNNPATLPTTALGTTNWTAIVSLSEGINYITIWAIDNSENISLRQKINAIYRKPPAENDLFYYSSSRQLSSTNGTFTDSNVEATKEFNEPSHAGNEGGKSIWYQFTPTESGVLVLSTLGSSFDTLLAVYTPTNTPALLTNLEEVVSNDDVPGAGSYSEVTLTVQAGRTYYIAVDGYDAASGTVKLNWTFSPSTIYRLDVSSEGGGTVSPRPLVSGLYFPAGAAVSVVATPGPGARFDHFEAPFGSTTQNPLTITMTGNTSVHAVFSNRGFSDDFEPDFHLPFKRVNWSIGIDPTNQLNHVAQSVGSGDRQTNTLTLVTRTAAGTGSFDYGTGTETNYDRLEFYVTYLEAGAGLAPARLGAWSGQTRGNFQFDVQPGLVQLQWRYVKDAAISEAPDTVFIDNFDLPIIQGATALTLKNQTITVRSAALPGEVVVIEASNDLKTWNAIGVAEADQSGNVSFREGIGTSNRFYRVISQ
jgi:subtilisin family serine protease